MSENKAKAGEKRRRSAAEAAALASMHGESRPGENPPGKRNYAASLLGRMTDPGDLLAGMADRDRESPSPEAVRVVNSAQPALARASAERALECAAERMSPRQAPPAKPRAANHGRLGVSSSGAGKGRRVDGAPSHSPARQAAGNPGFSSLPDTGASTGPLVRARQAAGKPGFSSLPDTDASTGPPLLALGKLANSGRPEGAALASSLQEAGKPSLPPPSLEEGAGGRPRKARPRSAGARSSSAKSPPRVTKLSSALQSSPSADKSEACNTFISAASSNTFSVVPLSSDSQILSVSQVRRDASELGFRGATAVRLVLKYAHTGRLRDCVTIAPTTGRTCGCNNPPTESGHG
jgi:hypothetical protein